MFSNFDWKFAAICDTMKLELFMGMFVSFVNKREGKNMFCQRCGQPLPYNAGFCPNCGAPVSPASQQTQVRQQGYGSQGQTRSGIDLRGKSVAFFILMVINGLAILFAPVLVDPDGYYTVCFIGEKNWPFKLSDLEGSEIIFSIGVLTALIVTAYTFSTEKKMACMIASIANFACNGIYSYVLITTLLEEYEIGSNPVPMNPILNVCITCALMILAIIAFNKSRPKKMPYYNNRY